MANDKAVQSASSTSEMIAELRRRAGFGPSILKRDAWVTSPEDKAPAKIFIGTLEPEAQPTPGLSM